MVQNRAIVTMAESRIWYIERRHFQSPSASCIRVMNHDWSARKQYLHPQSVARISRHSALSEDRI